MLIFAKVLKSLFCIFERCNVLIVIPTCKNGMPKPLLKMEATLLWTLMGTFMFPGRLKIVRNVRFTYVKTTWCSLSSITLAEMPWCVMAMRASLRMVWRKLELWKTEIQRSPSVLLTPVIWDSKNFVCWIGLLPV